METLNSPQCSGPLARLRDEFGADSPVAINNTITMLFAGFDTTSSSLTYLLWLLARHPEVMAQVSSAGDSRLGACTQSAGVVTRRDCLAQWLEGSIVVLC